VLHAVSSRAEGSGVCETRLAEPSALGRRDDALNSQGLIEILTRSTRPMGMAKRGMSTGNGA
jgi:hypothetical protein